MSSKKMEGLAQNRSRRPYPAYEPCDDVDDEEELPRMKEESSSLTASRPGRALWPSNRDGDRRELKERKKLYLLPQTAIEDGDKQVIQALVEEWIDIHERKGQKIIATVISCCLKAFFPSTGNIRMKAWKYWDEVLDSYDLTIMDRYPCVKHLDPTAARMRDRMFEAMDDLPLIKKAKAFGQEFSTEVDFAYTLLKLRANEFAHKMAQTALGQEHIDQTNIDPSKRYIICPDDFTYSSEQRRPNLSLHSSGQNKTAPTTTNDRPNVPSLASKQRPVPLAKAVQDVIPATPSQITQSPFQTAPPTTDAATPTRGERNAEFAQATAKSKAKARALAELKVREVDLKIEKLQAERALLELDGEDI